MQLQNSEETTYFEEKRQAQLEFDRRRCLSTVAKEVHCYNCLL